MAGVGELHMHCIAPSLTVRAFGTRVIHNYCGCPSKFNDKKLLAPKTLKTVFSKSRLILVIIDWDPQLQ